MELDWQNRFIEIKDRGQHLLATEKWADCHFLVGNHPCTRLIAGHKLILAMASPVFERMFFGTLPPDKDPIKINDVQPDTFMTMLEYIYSDHINITSFDKACELYYVGKKYMLPHIVMCCEKFLLSVVNPENACQLYEFAKLFDDQSLMEKSMEIIAKCTIKVLEDPNFTDIQPSTLMAILDQDALNVKSELDLFAAVVKYANERVYSNDDANKKAQHQYSNKKVEKIKTEQDVVSDEEADKTAYSLPAFRNKDKVRVIDSDASVADDRKNPNVPVEEVVIASTSSSTYNIMEMPKIIADETFIREAIKKIRFLTLSPQVFAECPATLSKHLKKDEAFAILMNISSESINECPMPAGFSKSRCPRQAPKSSIVYRNDNMALKLFDYKQRKKPRVGFFGWAWLKKTTKKPKKLGIQYCHETPYSIAHDHSFPIPDLNAI